MEEDADVIDWSGIEDREYKDIRTFFEKDRKWADYQSYQMHLIVEQGVVTQRKRDTMNDGASISVRKMALDSI